jgi:hypothetical protein
VLSAAGPLLVGVLRGATGGYTGMFVLVLAGVVGLTATGWLVIRQRHVDDEVPDWSSDRPRGHPGGRRHRAARPVRVSPPRDGPPSA